MITSVPLKNQKSLPLLLRIVVLVLSHILHEWRLIEQGIGNITAVHFFTITKLHDWNLHLGDCFVCKLINAESGVFPVSD